MQISSKAASAEKDLGSPEDWIEFRDFRSSWAKLSFAHRTYTFEDVETRRDLEFRRFVFGERLCLFELPDDIYKLYYYSIDHYTETHIEI